MLKLQLRPEQSTYNVDFGKGSLATGLQGGRGRYRRDIKGSSRVVNCTWQLYKTQYDYLYAFFYGVTREGSLPFIADLIIDGADMQEYTCYFIPDTFKMQSNRGLNFVVGAQLEALSPKLDEALLEGIVVMFNAFGENWQDYEDRLDFVTNHKWKGLRL